jgi:hypothetical protein
MDDIMTNSYSDTSSSAGCVESRDTLVSNENFLSLKSSEHHLGNPFSVSFVSKGGLSNDNPDSISRVNSEHIKGVAPDPFHFIP